MKIQGTNSLPGFQDEIQYSFSKSSRPGFEPVSQPVSERFQQEFPILIRYSFYNEIQNQCQESISRTGLKKTIPRSDCNYAIPQNKSDSNDCFPWEHSVGLESQRF